MTNEIDLDTFQEQAEKWATFPDGEEFPWDELKTHLRSIPTLVARVRELEAKEQANKTLVELAGLERDKAQDRIVEVRAERDALREKYEP